MFESVKIARRQSEIRQSLAGLVGKSDATADEIRSMETMDAEYRQNETRYRAALIAEDIPVSQKHHQGRTGLAPRSGGEVSFCPSCGSPYRGADGEEDRAGCGEHGQKEHVDALELRVKEAELFRTEPGEIRRKDEDEPGRLSHMDGC